MLIFLSLTLYLFKRQLDSAFFANSVFEGGVMMSISQDQETVQWLTRLVLGAASAVPAKDKPKPTGTITGVSGEPYAVCELLATTEQARLYQAILLSMRFGIIKIAVNQKENGCLDREALALKIMAERAAEVETKNTSGKPYNYHCFFPRLEESFICASQGGRRINVLSLTSGIEDLTQLESLSNLSRNRRVDPRTSVWIIG